MEERKLNLKLKSSKGITLIALVVTIVVLLILAGVSITTIIGNNGILSKATEAKEKTENASKNEKYDLAKIEDIINESQTGIVVDQVTDINPGILEGIGTDIASEYNGISDGTAVTRMPYVSLDITDRTAVEQVIEKLKPDAVVHCAAWTAVDLAEDDDKKAKVHAINADGTQNIADACKKIDAKMVYISTDYVFDGQGTTPWQPDCKDYAPLNVYGQTKLDGELAVANTLEKYFIVRIAWVFGVNGKNFIKTMLNVGKTHDRLTVVSDQIGTPTYTLDLSRLLVDMIETDKYGYYHATNEGGYISWYDFTKEIFKQAVELGHT